MTEFLPNIMTYTWITYVIYCLATWRISNILVKENSPFDIARKIQELLGKYEEKGKPSGHDENGLETFYERTPLTLRNTLAGIWGCIWCMSVWVSLLIVVLVAVSVRNDVYLYWFVNGFCTVFAFSAGSLIVNRIVTGE